MNKIVLHNFSFLTILQGVTVLAPLLTYPYLIRVIGDERFGAVIWSYSIMQFFIVLINFGFNITGTKQIAEAETDEQKREIVSSIYIIKTGLFLISFLVLLGLILGFTTFRNEKLLLFSYFFITVGEVLVPIWFFQGIEKMKFLTIVNGGAKILSTLFVFLLVASKTDYYLVPIIQSVFAVMAGVGSVFILSSILNKPFKRVKFSVLKRDFLDGLQFLASRLSSIVIERVNILLIQSFLGFSEVTYYDFATKIVNLVKIPYDLLNQAIYPYIIRTQKMQIVQKIILLIGLSGILVIGVIHFYGGPIYSIVAGESNLLGIRILKLLIWVAPITGIGFFLGNTALVLKGYNRYFNLSIIYAMLLYVAIITGLYLFEEISAYSLALTYLVITLFWVSYRAYYVLKLKILPV